MATSGDSRCVVSLLWYDKRNTDGALSSCGSTGFVSHCSETNGFSIISTYHQVKTVFPKERDNVPVEHIAVKVTFYDRKTIHNGVTHVDQEKDLMLIMVPIATDVIKILPLCNVQSVVLAKDSPYLGQKLYSMHHPIASSTNGAAHYICGFIAAVNFPSSGKVHYYLPLITQRQQEHRCSIIHQDEWCVWSRQV